ncbi:MAG: recombinase family protein [Phycisphaerae bacterium]|nr:recombinase family protein [Phycisphaerae bacterium]
MPEEAEVVRLAFELYLRTRSIGLTAKRLNARGFKQKKHVSKTGREVGGRPWDKNTVHRLLRNPLYVGIQRFGHARCNRRCPAKSVPCRTSTLVTQPASPACSGPSRIVGSPR